MADISKIKLPNDNNTYNLADLVARGRIWQGTQAQYDALVQAGTIDPDTVYFVTDGTTVACASNEVSYNHTISGLSASDVKGALDELAYAITPYYYNANTDRNTQENRETAIKYVLTNYFSKGGTSATIRYSGGYYNSYIYCGGSSSNLQIIEFCQLQSSGEKVIYWMYTISNNELNKIFALS